LNLKQIQNKEIDVENQSQYLNLKEVNDLFENVKFGQQYVQTTNETAFKPISPRGNVEPTAPSQTSSMYPRVTPLMNQLRDLQSQTENRQLSDFQLMMKVKKYPGCALDQIHKKKSNVRDGFNCQNV